MRPKKVQLETTSAKTRFSNLPKSIEKQVHRINVFGCVKIHVHIHFLTHIHNFILCTTHSLHAKKQNGVSK